jgi:ectoine hydroxylase
MSRPSAVAGNSATVTRPMTAEQRATFERDGYLILHGALAPDEAAAAREAIDRARSRRHRDRGSR